MIKTVVSRKIIFSVIAMIISAGLYAQQVEFEEGAAADQKVEQSEETVEVKEEKVKLTKEEKAAAKKKAAEEKKAAKLAAAEKLKEKHDDLLDITYIPVKKYIFQNGKAGVSLKASTGTFIPFAVNGKGKKVLLLADSDGGDNTYFALKAGNTVYNLTKNAAVKKSVRKLADGAQIVYTLDKIAQVAVGFSTYSSKSDNPADMIRVVSYVTNLAETDQELSLKCVLDTVLGEGTDSHFTTSGGTVINCETQFKSMKNNSAVLTSNGETGLQIILDGLTVSSPSCVSFSACQTLQNGPWIPVITEGKTFNKSLSYSNSALAVNWNSKVIKSKETAAYSFYLAVGTDKNSPAGLEYLDSLTKIEEFTELSSTSDVNDLDFERIQNLINRINSLKTTSDAVDYEEVRMLNAELDEVIQKLRQR